MRARRKEGLQVHLHIQTGKPGMVQSMGSQRVGHD